MSKMFLQKKLWQCAPGFVTKCSVLKEDRNSTNYAFLAAVKMQCLAAFKFTKTHFTFLDISRGAKRSGR